MSAKTIILTAIVLVGLPAARAHAISSYSLADLGNHGGQSIARGLNDENQVVGYSMLPNSNETAFLWQQSTGMENLGTLPGDNQSYALSINDAGQITGGSQGNPDIQVQGVLWQSNSGMIDIGAGTNMTVEPFGINQQGQIFGSSDAGGFIYSKSTGFTRVTVPGMSVDSVFAVNSQGQMVVESNSTGVAFYSPTQGVMPIRDSTEPGIDNFAFGGMNEGGTVVGTIPSPVTGTMHGFIWNQATGSIDLASGPNDTSDAIGINDLGQVVGGASLDGDPFFPFLYENGTMYDLMPYLTDTATGWSNLNLTAINDNGDIAGYGLYNGQEEAFLLTPAVTTNVPEPTIAVFIAGIGLFDGRKRRISNTGVTHREIPRG